MTVKQLTEHHLEFLNLTGGCTGSSESTLVKTPHCWKSHITAQLLYFPMKGLDLWPCYWVILHTFYYLLIFFSKLTFSKNSFKNNFRFSNSLDPDQAQLLLGLIWVQTVCKGSQQVTLVGKKLTLLKWN